MEDAQKLAADAAAAAEKLRKERQQKRATEARRNSTPPQTAAEATLQMLAKKRLDSKINYAVLNELFEESVSGYCGLLLGSTVILYEIITFILSGLTSSERRFLGPIVLRQSILFYAGIVFSYLVLTSAPLNFFVNYAEGFLESLWSIDQYFEFVLVLMFSKGLSFQVCCDGCDVWIHAECAKISGKLFKDLEETDYYCPECKAMSNYEPSPSQKWQSKVRSVKNKGRA